MLYQLSFVSCGLTTLLACFLLIGRGHLGGDEESNPDSCRLVRLTS